MVGKLITLAIVAVLLYGLYLRLKVKFTGNPNEKIFEQKHLRGETTKRSQIRKFSAISVIVSSLAILYLVWAAITLLRT